MHPLKRIMSKRCDECLMTPNKIVSDARKDEVLAECDRRNCLFNCHKATIAGGQDVACRGHAEKVLGRSTLDALVDSGLIAIVDSSELLAEWDRRKKVRRKKNPSARGR